MRATNGTNEIRANPYIAHNSYDAREFDYLYVFIFLFSSPFFFATHDLRMNSSFSNIMNPSAVRYVYVPGAERWPNVYLGCMCNCLGEDAIFCRAGTQTGASFQVDGSDSF